MLSGLDPCSMIYYVPRDAHPYPPALLREFPAVADVRVGVQKPHVAVTGVLGSLGVEIFQTRG